MDIKYLNKLLSDDVIVSEKIKQYIEDKSIKKLSVDKEEMKGHILKSDHNLSDIHQKSCLHVS